MTESCRTARYELKRLRVGDSPGTFFPLSSLRKFFTRAKILDILTCTCPQCQKHALFFPGQHIWETYATTITGGVEAEDTTPTYYLGFGLLLLVEHPLLIIGFTEKQNDDVYFERWTRDPLISSSKLLKTWTGHYASKHSQDFQGFSEEFRESIAHFAIPHLQENWVKYHSGVVLPFSGQRRIGKRVDATGESVTEGANSKVFAFKLHAEYHHFKSLGSSELVRKEISTPHPQALMERGSNEFVQGLQHKHIVRLITVYGHGETVNLILPRARTNLNRLLRDREHKYWPQSPKIEMAPAWEQMLGIVEALKRFQGIYEGPKNASNLAPSLLGIHFDLKPDNILVDYDGTWLITDFGQAAVIQRQPGVSPRVGGHFGTDGYAPPEIDDERITFTRKYDVWSLGCILLEVTAFLVRGYSGLVGADGYVGLDEARRSSSNAARPNVSEERFFYKEDVNGAWVVKREIYDFMDDLERGYIETSDRSQASKAFLSSILKLVKRMLSPKIVDRPDMALVMSRLNDSLSSSRSTAPTIDQPNCDLGPNTMQVLHWSEIRNAWEDSTLTIERRREMIVRLDCRARGRDRVPIEFKSTGVKILPLYAFWNPKELHESGSWLSLTYISKGAPLPVGNSEFCFDGNAGLEEARNVQSRLISQDIVESFDLEGLCLTTTPTSTRENISHFFKRMASKETGGSSNFGTATVQLWRQHELVENLDAHRGNTEGTTNAGRESRFWEDDRLKVPTCRIAIHIHQQRFICTIRMDKNWVVAKVPANERALDFKPNPQASKEPFFASWLRPTPEELDDVRKFPAGVPVVPEVLWYTEDLDTFGVAQVRLSFARAADRTTFVEDYTKVKEAWVKAYDGLETKIKVNRMPDAEPQMPHGIDIPPMPRTKARLIPMQGASLDPRASGSSIETNNSRGSTTGRSTDIDTDPRYLAPSDAHQIARRTRQAPPS